MCGTGTLDIVLDHCVLNRALTQIFALTHYPPPGSIS